MKVSSSSQESRQSLGKGGNQQQKDQKVVIYTHEQREKNATFHTAGFWTLDVMTKQGLKDVDMSLAWGSEYRAEPMRWLC